MMFCMGVGIVVVGLLRWCVIVRYVIVFSVFFFSGVFFSVFYCFIVLLSSRLVIFVVVGMRVLCFRLCNILLNIRW